MMLTSNRGDHSSSQTMMYHVHEQEEEKDPAVDALAFEASLSPPSSSSSKTTTHAAAGADALASPAVAPKQGQGQQQQPERQQRSQAQQRRLDKNFDGGADDEVIETWISNMSIDDKIGQMSQIDIAVLLTDDRSRLNRSSVEEYVGARGVGSVLNTPNADGEYWNASQYFEASRILRDAARRYGRPPVIWGLDSVHGANYIRNATLTPQPINVAATFNRSVAYRAGYVAARDTYAAGISWVFSPLVGVALEPRWSRVYETYGEDPYVVGEMASATVRGIQQQQQPNQDPSPPPPPPIRVAACAKHFVGYSAPRDGHDRSPSWIPRRHLYQYFVPPWKKVIRGTVSDGNGEDDNGVLTIMESYTDMDGIPNVDNRQTLQHLLRQTLGFEHGVLVTDYSEMYNMEDWHHIAYNKSMAVLQSLRQGSVDMSMIPFDYQTYRDAIRHGLKNHPPLLSLERIDTSVRRILRLKRKLGLLSSTWDDATTATATAAKDENGNSNSDSKNLTLTKEQQDLINMVGSDHMESYEMAKQGIVLAKNDPSVLPIEIEDDGGQQQQRQIKILVTGPTSHSLSYQCGGWTGNWQGVPDDEDPDRFFWRGDSSTVLSALSQRAHFDVTYTCGVDISGKDCQDAKDPAGGSGSLLDQVKNFVVQGVDELEGAVAGGVDPSTSIGRAVLAASSAGAGVDYVVICVGEESYTEKPGDLRDLQLPPGQYELVRQLKQHQQPTTGDDPSYKLIVVYFGGRARLFQDIAEHADAVVLAMLPGPYGGQAVTDILSGAYNPSAKLPITWPKYQDNGGVPYYRAVSDQCTGGGDGPLPHYEYEECDVEFPFGHGLSYTSFAYSNLQAAGGVDEDLHLSVRVQNVGKRSGADAVLFFTFDEYRANGPAPEYKRLRYFEKVALEPGEAKTVRAVVPLEELKFVGPHDETHYIVDPTMTSYVGVGASINCRRNDDDRDGALCVKVQSKDPNREYNPACEAACDVWESSGCTKRVFGGGGSSGGSNNDPSSSPCMDACMSISRYPASAMDGNNDGWGWDYVRCIENIAWGDRAAATYNGGRDSPSSPPSASNPDLCWKLRYMCRDVLATGTLDEYGVSGAASSGEFLPSHGAGGGGGYGGGVPAVNFVALSVALVATGVMVFWMNGGNAWLKRRRRSNPDRSDVQFTRVSSSAEET